MTSWRSRLAVLVVIWAGCLAIGVALSYDPHPWRTLLVVAVVVVLAGLHADTLLDPPVPWHREHPDRDDWSDLDPRTVFYTRLLESHLTSRGGDPVVRDRLLRLGQETLRSRGAVRDDPGLDGLAALPPERLTREEIARWLDRIEEL